MFITVDIKLYGKIFLMVLASTKHSWNAINTLLSLLLLLFIITMVTTIYCYYYSLLSSIYVVLMPLQVSFLDMRILLKVICWILLLYAVNGRSEKKISSYPLILDGKTKTILTELVHQMFLEINHSPTMGRKNVPFVLKCGTNTHNHMTEGLPGTNSYSSNCRWWADTVYPLSLE